MNLKPKPLIKKEESKTGEQLTEKCSWEPSFPFCKSQEQKEEQGKVQPQQLSASHKTKNPKFEYDQGQTTVGRRDGKVEF